MKMNCRILLPLLLLVLTASRCQKGQDQIQLIPLQFEDGTVVLPQETDILSAAWKDGDSSRFHASDAPVLLDDPARYVYGDEQVGKLVNTDEMILETVVQQEDTTFLLRHASAFIRLELQGLPAGREMSQVQIICTRGEPVFRSFPGIVIPPEGSLTVWTALPPQDFSGEGFAVLVHGLDGGLWTVRFPGTRFQGGIACRWTAACLPHTETECDLSATPLPQTLLDGVQPGEYSGITWISGDDYAVVSDNLKGGGIVRFTIPIDADGSVGEVRAEPAPGTKAAGGKAPDSEGIAYADGKLYVSTEQQQIREFDLDGRATGKAFRIPADMSVKQIAANRGFEALTFRGGHFWTTTEAPLLKDSFLPRVLRLQRFDRDGKPAGRYFYQTGLPGKSATEAAGAQAYVFGVPALSALDDGRLLVLEREVFVPKGGFLTKLLDSFTESRIYVVDPVHDPAGILRKSLLCSFTTGAVDLANYEGMCLGPVLPDGSRTILLIADSQNGSGGLTGEYVKVILLR